MVNTDPKLRIGWQFGHGQPFGTRCPPNLGSPAIKAGLTLSAVLDDFAGIPRIAGLYDIGSYAFALASASCSRPIASHRPLNSCLVPAARWMPYSWK